MNQFTIIEKIKGKIFSLLANAFNHIYEIKESIFIRKVHINNQYLVENFVRINEIYVLRQFQIGNELAEIPKKIDHQFMIQFLREKKLIKFKQIFINEKLEKSLVF